MTNDPDAQDLVYLTDVFVIPSSVEDEESGLVGRLEEWWKRPGKAGALAGVQPTGSIGQEVGEEEAAHPGRLYEDGLGALGQETYVDHVTQEQKERREKIQLLGKNTNKRIFQN